MKQWMPVFLVVAIAAGVAFAAFSTNASAPVAAAQLPAPPLDTPLQGEPEDPLDPDQPDEAEDPAGETTGAAIPEATLTGVVQERFDVDQYTYVRLAGDAGQTWAAIYKAPVTVGKSVTLVHVNALKNFHSRELNRDFDVIYFGVLPGFESAPSSSAAALAVPAAASSKVSMKPLAGAITIAELAKKASSMVGKEVTVVGRVSKETDGILDRNWIHLVDGTGEASDGSNDLLVTTSATAGVGEDVVVHGTVNVNQDYGAGYAYKFLVEKASVAPTSK